MANQISYEVIAVRQSDADDSVAFVQFYTTETRTREEAFVDTVKEDMEFDYSGETITYTVNVPILDVRSIEYSVKVPVDSLQKIAVPAGRNTDDVVSEFISNKDNFVTCKSCSLMFIENPMLAQDVKSNSNSMTALDNK